MKIENQKTDNVNHPAHYTAGGIECIEAIKASMTPEEFRGYLKGTIMAYLWRYQNKGNPLEDLLKSDWYLQRLIKELQDVEALARKIPEDCKDCQQEYRCDWDRSHCPLK